MEKRKEQKTFKVSLNWTSLIIAKTEQEAINEANKIFDNSFLKLSCKEVFKNE